jgi:hypothetical protein
LRDAPGKLCIEYSSLRSDRPGMRNHRFAHISTLKRPYRRISRRIPPRSPGWAGAVGSRLSGGRRDNSWPVSGSRLCGQQLCFEAGDALVEEAVVGAGGLQAFFQGALCA